MKDLNLSKESKESKEYKESKKSKDKNTLFKEPANIYNQLKWLTGC